MVRRSRLASGRSHDSRSVEDEGPLDHSYHWEVLIGLSGFRDHLQLGHGIKDPPEDDTAAWQLHQRLHDRSAGSPWWDPETGH